MSAWIKRREVVNRAKRIRNKKFRGHQYRGGYARSLESKGVKWDGQSTVELMWEQVKQAMVESVRFVWLNESRRNEPKDCMVE